MFKPKISPDIYADDDQDTPAAAPASVPDPYAKLFDLVTLMSRPKQVRAHLRELRKQTAEAQKAKADADASLAALSEKENELAVREQAVNQREAEIAEREAAEGKERQEKLDQIYWAGRKLEELNDQMKRAVLRYGNWLDGYNERLQSLPDWPAIDRLFKPSDAHYPDDNGEKQEAEPRPAFDPDIDPGFELAAIPGSTITRTAPLSRRTAEARRAQRREGAAG